MNLPRIYTENRDPKSLKGPANSEIGTQLREFTPNLHLKLGPKKTKRSLYVLGPKNTTPFMAFEWRKNPKSMVLSLKNPLG